MYQERGLKRLGITIIADILIFAVCGVFFAIGRLMFFSSADNNSGAGVSLPVIMYHSIYSGSPGEYIVTPAQAESDLIWLRDHGYTAVSAAEVIAYTEGHGELPDKPVLITLDDGFYNCLSDYLPLLEKYDMCAVMAVVGKYTDELASADPHVPAYSYLTWNDVEELYNSGRVEIASHTYDMHSLKGRRRGCTMISGENEEDYRNVLSADIDMLQNEVYSHIGAYPEVFAYPFGGISRPSISVLKSCGIKMTLTCYEKPNIITRDPDCLYGICRYNRSGLYSTEEFMSKLTGE